MSNIPGATNVLPGVFTDVVTESRGTAVAGGLRVPAIMGQGLTTQTIVAAAVGNGKDGLNPSYTSANGADGRHFLLSSYPVVLNRTTLYRNGVPLVGLEGKIVPNTTFAYAYDYRFDRETGRIEMQSAHLQDLGGDNYAPFTTNKGDGYVSTLTLVDKNASQETWSVRCVSVRRDNSNQPIPGTAKFIAVGSISGNKTDAAGNPKVWTSNGEIVSNDIISFAINQNVGGTPFQEGDGFSIKVVSGKLSPNDSLVATYIVESYLNDPVQLQGMDQVAKRFGNPSVSNSLSLGAQLAFANSASSIMALQCAPPVPRRTPITLSEGVKSTSVLPDDFVFPLPLNFVPDPDANIHFFVTDNATGIETQSLPNKYDYYTVNTTGKPTYDQFIFDSQYSFSYSLVQNYENNGTIISGFDGYIARDLNNVSGDNCVFSIPNFVFSKDTFQNKIIKIIDAENVANNAEYTITSVVDNKLYGAVVANSYDPWVSESSLEFEVIEPSTGLPISGYSGSDGIITFVPGSEKGATATITSTVTFTNLTGKRLKVKTAGPNQGTFDIVSYIGTNQLGIKKSVVIESGLTYSILDPDLKTMYVIIHNDVVPDGYGLRVNVINEKDAKFYDAGWIYALESLEKTNVDIVVPLPSATISVIFQNALNHCLTMSKIRNRKERVLFVLIGSATDGTNTPVAVEDIGILEGIQGDVVLDGSVEDLANYSVSDAFGGTYRCVYFYPDQIVVQAGVENVLIDGFYIAAAAAGYLAGQPRVEIPLTNKVLSGFSILRNKLFSQLTLESLASSGVCTLQPVAGGGRVVWGITTTQSGFAEEQEISIVFIRDRIAKSLRASFAGYIGLPETQTTQITLANQAINVLNSFINQSLITAYADLTVQRDSVDPRQWNILVKVQPTYPVNWIYIRVGVGTI